MPVAISINVPLDSDLVAIADLATAGLIERIGSGSAAIAPITPYGKSAIAAADAAALTALLQAGSANRPALLGSDGRLPFDQLSTEVLGAAIFGGTWNPITNSPTLASGVGVAGKYYVCSTGGTTVLDGVGGAGDPWSTADVAIFDGTVWRRIDARDAVLSVNGQTGVVTLTAANVGAIAVGGITVPSGFSFSGSTLSYATGQAANRLLATPDGTAGSLSLRALAAGDIPSLSSVYLPLSGGTIAGNLTVNQKLSIAANTSQNSAEFGSLGIQGYAINNCWLGDNLYFNSAYYRRATGKASFVQFFNGTILLRCEETSDVADSAISPVTAMTVADAYVQMGVPLLNHSLTTTQRDALPVVVNGMLIYNTTTGKFQGRAGSAWGDLASTTSLNGWSISETFLSAGVGAHCTTSVANSGVVYLPYQFTPTFLAFAGLSSVSRQGFVTLETLTATNSRSILIGPALNFNSGANVEFTSDVYIRSPQSDVTNAYSVVVGFSNLLSSDADDGIYFWCDKSISDYWQIRTANDSVANTSQKTSVTTAVLVEVDTWISFKIVVTGVTSAAFYINNSLVGTITTNLPVATRMTHLQWRILRSAGTSTRRIIIDGFNFKYEIVS